MTSDLAAEKRQLSPFSYFPTGHGSVPSVAVCVVGGGGEWLWCFECCVTVIAIPAAAI